LQKERYSLHGSSGFFAFLFPVLAFCEGSFMSCQLGFVARACGAGAVALTLVGVCQAQIGFGVNANGSLFSFDVTAAGSIPTTTIGNVGFTPEGIDFRPGTNILYAIDIGATTTQLYTININNAVATPVGPGFPSMDAGYNLTGNQRFGFDFNPSTLQADNSMRIRLVATNNDNLRLNSDTGLIAATDVDLNIQPGGAAPFVDGAAYLNNVPNIATMATTLYDMDSRNDSLYTQNPPNGGQLNLVGPFLAPAEEVNPGIGFDIYTVPGDNDPSLTGDSAYAVLTRNATQNGAYLLYQVNLTTGTIFNGKLVGPVGTPADFTGGFAIAPLPIPEPVTVAMLAFGFALCSAIRRRLS
jgi:Domain of unknown function (DUF4394)